MPNQLAKVMLASLLALGGGYQAVYAAPAAGAQQAQSACTGTVIDSTGEPVIGASVFAVGTNKGGSTNIDGEFSIAGIAVGTTLRISCVGYATQEVKWTGAPIQVTLADNATALDEVVVVGYGTQKKVNLTGAVAAVSGDVLADRPITNIGQGLQGKIANLNITASNGGAPGATSNFNVRGTTSLNGGGPLVLVDNVQMDPNLVNPDDIEQISVLKDGASAAIYGARAAYGVILITTKKGKAKEKPTISFGASVNWSRAAMEFHKVNSLDYINMMDQASINDNGAGKTYISALQRQYVEAYFNGTWAEPVFVDPDGDGKLNKYTYCGNTDWWDALYKTSFNQQYNMSISGGTGKSTYFASVSMVDQGSNRVGAIDEKYQRFNARLNVDTQINNWLKVGLTMSNAYQTQQHPTGSGNSGVSQMTGMFKNDLSPLMPLKHPNGDYAGQGSFTNPVAVAELGGNSRYRSNDLWITGMAQITPYKGLLIQADYTWNVYSFNRSFHQQKFMEYGIDHIALDYYPWTSRPTYNQQNNNNDYYQAFNAFAQYEWTIADNHNFKVMTGYNQEKKTNSGFMAYRPNLMTNESMMLQYATGDPSVSSSATLWSINSWFGRINYDYAGKYLAEFTWRYDGSSKFPKGDRYVWSPSGSLGWRISEENFFESVRDWWNNLKLRVSYGRMGNQAIRDEDGNFPYIATYPVSSKIGMILNGGRPVGVGTPGLVSASFSWEKVDQFDVGFDLGFLNNRLTAEFDWYQRDTKGMLVPGAVLPSVLGTSVPRWNAGDLRTTGWELAVTWNDRVNSIGLNYHVRATLSDYMAKITKYDNPTGILSSYYVGRKIGEIWGYESDGLFQSQAEIDAAPSQKYIWGGDWEPGMTRYNDLNNDGKIDVGDNTLENHGDIKIIGNSTPRYQFGITLGAEWKNFDFDMFWQGTGKRDYWTTSNEFFPFNNQWSTPQDFTAGDYWTEDNPGAYFPKLSFGKLNGASRQTSTRYLQNAAYGRLKSVMLGYSIPQNILNKVGIQRLRVYVQGENLLTITPMKKWTDPETLGNMTYPLQKKIAIGLNLTL